MPIDFKRLLRPLPERVETAYKHQYDTGSMVYLEMDGVCVLPRFQHTIITLTNNMVIQPCITVGYNGEPVINFLGPAEYFVRDFVKTLKNKQPGDTYCIDGGKDWRFDYDQMQILKLWLWSIKLWEI